MITYRNGMPALHGHDLKQLLDTVGSPLYAYSGHRIDEDCQALLRTLRPHAELVYSVKVNGNPHLVARLAKHGVGVEVASAGELFIALRAGVTPERILFGGPGKTEEEIQFAIQNRIDAFNAESLRELERIDRLAGEAGVVQRVLLRVNPLLSHVKARIRMGGASRQFGVDEETLPEVLTSLRQYLNIRLVGLFVYMGTQILDVDSIVSTTEHVLGLATRFVESNDLPLEVLDFGGGFGIPYFHYETDLNLTDLQQRLDGCFNAWKERFPALLQTRFLFESGRFLLARSGFYLTRVVDIKESRGKTFVVTDGGMNQNAASAGIGRVVREDTPVLVLRPEGHEEQRRAVTVVGPTCTPVDVLHSALTVSDVQIGDIVAVPHAGAYGMTMSPLYFCGHPTPAEVLIEEGQITSIRRRGTLEELLWNTGL